MLPESPLRSLERRNRGFETPQGAVGVSGATVQAGAGRAAAPRRARGSGIGVN